MTNKQKRLTAALIMAAAAFGVMPAANAMHIMEGALPPGCCVAWGLVCLPFLAAGYFSIQRRLRENPRVLTLLAMSGAFVFVISSLKIPSVSGSCSHMTGTGLGAILFGPAAVSVLGVIVLVFQALLLAHGGLTTLGANTFSMAIAGPAAAWLLYRLLLKTKADRRAAAFAAAFLGDLFTYSVTAFQLALAHNSAVTFGGALKANLAVFAGTQLPLAVVEGILTAVIVIGLESYAVPELRAVGFLKEER